MTQILIRPATIEDASLLLSMITDLARYERAECEVVATIDDLQKSLFGDDATAKALICTIDKNIAGYAIYFYNYSTWLGKRGLFLEDLYISPQYRGKGGGKEMLQFLARTAVDNNCGRFEWNVLRWNSPAISFYEMIGAKPQDEWVGYRLAGDALMDFAGKKLS